MFLKDRKMDYKYNFKNAFTYFKQDEKLVKKFFLGYLIVVLSMALTPDNFKSTINIIAYVIGLILFFVFQGYIVNNSHNRIFKPENKLPDWIKLPSLFKKGLFSAIGPTLFSIIIGLPLGGIFVGILYLTATLKIPSTPAFILICLLTGLLIFLLILGACASYVGYITDLKLKSCFKPKTIYQIAFKNFPLFIKYLCVIFVITIALFLFVFLLIAIPVFIIAGLASLSHIMVIDEESITYIAKPVTILLPPFATVFFSYIYSDINAQFIRQISN